MDNDTLMIIVVVMLAMMLMKGNMLSNLFSCGENFSNYIIDSPHCAAACANRIPKDFQCERNCQAEYLDCRNEQDEGKKKSPEFCKKISSDADPFNYYDL